MAFLLRPVFAFKSPVLWLIPLFSVESHLHQPPGLRAPKDEGVPCLVSGDLGPGASFPAGTAEELLLAGLCSGCALP